MYAISPVQVVTGRQVLDHQTVLVQGRQISGILSADSTIPPGFSVIQGDDQLLIPGMIDVHIHGANGFDMTDGSIESILETSLACSRTGCTGFVRPAWALSIR